MNQPSKRDKSSDMENPFKQLVPDQKPPKEQIQEEVMSSVHLKSHFSDILEFFMAIFGVKREETVSSQGVDKNE